MLFYFMLKAYFVLEILAFLSWISGYVEKRLDKEAMVLQNQKKVRMKM